MAFKRLLNVIPNKSLFFTYRIQVGVASPSLFLQPAGRRCTEAGAGRRVGEGESDRGEERKGRGRLSRATHCETPKAVFLGSFFGCCLFVLLFISVAAELRFGGGVLAMAVGWEGGMRWGLVFFVFIAAPSLSARLARRGGRDELVFCVFSRFFIFRVFFFYLLFLFPPRRLSFSRFSLAWPICQEETKAVLFSLRKKQNKTPKTRNRKNRS